MTTLIKHISYDELRAWEKENRDFQLIDVREPEEHEAFNIGGELLPLSSIFTTLDRLDANTPIVFYCKRGIRSQIAIQRIADRFPNTELYNLQNGIVHLKQEKKAAKQ